jgi:signal transduction histidine kinase
MRERAALLDGELKLTGKPGRRTSVEVVIPLKGER